LDLSECLQICSAITYCHSMRIVHRDLKPENILIVNKPEDEDCSGFIQYPLVKLIDFGFSNQWKEGEKLRTSCGSLAYSAPEILLGEHYDGDKVDIWGLGCILYILLYGSNPFMQINDSETLIRILDCNYNTPQRAHVNEKAIDLIKCLLRKEPIARLTVQQTLEHIWLAESIPNAGSFQAAIPSIPASDVSSTDSSVTDLRTSVATIEDDDMLELKRKLGKVKCEQDKEKSALSRSFLHEKVIEQMVTQSMCTSKEQVELALKRSRDFANRAPAKFVRQAENDENSNRNAINQIHKDLPDLTCNAALIHNFNDNKLINEQIVSNEINRASTDVTLESIADTSNALNTEKLFNRDAYLTATYHLLKDKLFREHHGISITNQVLSKTSHHKKVLPNRPRKSVLKQPQFGSSTLRITTEEEAEHPESNGNDNEVNRTLELPFDEESGFALPLARKCSIVSEEGSCAGAELSGAECGSDSVLDFNHSNFHSLDSNNDNDKLSRPQTSSGARSSATMTFPCVDIIVTDCCEYDEDKLNELEEDQSLIIIQTHEVQNDSNKKSDTQDNQVEQVALNKKSSVNTKTDKSKGFAETVENEFCTSALKTHELGLTSSLHLASSSPDLLHSEEFKKNCDSQANFGDLIISATEHDDSSNLMRSHLKSQHRCSHNSSTDADFDPVLSKRQYFSGNNLLRTSFRIITQSKSCNNILLNENETDETSKDCSRKGSRKSWSRKKSSKQGDSSPADSVDRKPEADSRPNCSELKMQLKTNASKKHRNERPECCSLC
jgi:serine/threonine protein kinase